VEAHRFAPRPRCHAPGRARTLVGPGGLLAGLRGDELRRSPRPRASPSRNSRPLPSRSWSCSPDRTSSPRSSRPWSATAAR
jgi:hypothetical protein